MRISEKFLLPLGLEAHEGTGSEHKAGRAGEGRALSRPQQHGLEQSEARPLPDFRGISETRLVQSF